MTWLVDQNGLRFSRDGTILSSGTFHTTAQDDASSSLEIWLQPTFADASNTILAFSTPENPEQFLMQQYFSTLILKHNTPPGNRPEVIGIEGVFRQIRPVFIAITSGGQGTTAYIDGVLAGVFPYFRPAKDFRGQLVAGTAPTTSDSWCGQLRGLAIYQQELTSAQVRRHFETWIKQGRPELLGYEQPIAIYPFDEHSGSVVHNAVPQGIELYIPDRYLLLHERVLEPFWQEYRPGWSHWKDILVNVAGFIPLGFFFYAYWSAVRPIKRAVLITLLLGLTVSLTIEVLQSFLPTRSSGTTDLMTNTLGTFLGVKVYGLKTVRAMIERVYQALSGG